MKILLTGDWHVGESRTLTGYLTRQKLMIDRIFEVAAEHTDGVVIVGGDVFHRPDLEEQERHMLLGRLLHYDKAGVRIIMMSGNHDVIDRKRTALGFIRVLVTKKALRNTTLCETAPCVVEHGGVAFLMVPWGGYTAKAYRTLLRRWATTAKKEADVVVATVHEQLVGRPTDLGWAARSGPDINEKLPVDFWSAHHIHKAQPIAENGWLVGSPMQHRFDELQPKGVVLLDTDRCDEAEFVELEGIKPLVTLTDEDALDPDLDAYVRLVTTKRRKKVPKNVVKVVQDTEVVAVDRDALLSDPLAGLEDYFRQKLPEESIDRAMVIARDIHARAGA